MFHKRFLEYLQKLMAIILATLIHSLKFGMKFGMKFLRRFARDQRIVSIIIIKNICYPRTARTIPYLEFVKGQHISDLFSFEPKTE